MLEKQTVLLPMIDFTIHTCGECVHIYKLHLGKRSVYKCPIKPRGFGYDIPKKHRACAKFQVRTDEPLVQYGCR